MSYIGKTIDRYEFRSLIGKGTFGEVYRAFDNRLLRHVAIKAAFPKPGDDGQAKDNIIREAQIIARAEHANIIPIYDVIDDSESVLIVMRLVDGEDLSQMLQRLGGPLGVNEAFAIMRKVLEGMDYAHRKGIVHSDLKPGNILLTDDDEVVIMDFGLAALLEIQKPEKGKLYGTPYYMSPEQIHGKYLDARSDIYALGMILYRMITGRHPFEGVNSLQQLMSYQIERAPETPDKYNPAVTVKFSNRVLKALEKNPLNRYYSCREFIESLGDALPAVQQDEHIHQNQRWDPRVIVNLKARIKLEDSGGWVPVKMVNLSVNGACMAVPIALETGSSLHVEFEIPEDDNYVRMSSLATVMRKDTRPGNDTIEVGVNFDGLADMDKKYIALFIRSLLLK